MKRKMRRTWTARRRPKTSLKVITTPSCRRFREGQRRGDDHDDGRRGRREKPKRKWLLPPTRRRRQGRKQQKAKSETAPKPRPKMRQSPRAHTEQDTRGPDEGTAQSTDGPPQLGSRGGASSSGTRLVATPTANCTNEERMHVWRHVWRLLLNYADADDKAPAQGLTARQTANITQALETMYEQERMRMHEAFMMLVSHLVSDVARLLTEAPVTVMRREKRKIRWRMALWRMRPWSSCP